MSRMPTKQLGIARTREAWVELSRGAGIRLGILMRQVKIRPEHIRPSTRRTTK